MGRAWMESHTHAFNLKLVQRTTGVMAWQPCAHAYVHKCPPFNFGGHAASRQEPVSFIGTDRVLPCLEALVAAGKHATALPYLRDANSAGVLPAGSPSGLVVARLLKLCQAEAEP